MRIVSLLPSTTEILFALGADSEVVGVTFECDFPEEARSRRVVSSSSLPAGLSPGEIDVAVRERLRAGEDLYHLDAGALSELDPDLLLSQDLCAVCAVAVDTVDAALEHLGCQARVLTVDPMDLEAVLTSITVIGDAVGKTTEADAIVARLRERLARVAAAVQGASRPRVAVLEWPDPLFAAGHWVPDMVTAAGGDCVLGTSGGRSTVIGPEDVAAAEPDLIVVAPCGFRLEGATEVAAKLLAKRQLPPGIPLWAVDADAAFVRPGPRLIDGVEALAAICHPHAGPERAELAMLVGTTPVATF